MTALLHYFFLATFTWTLCEAVLVYILLVKVFGANDRKWIYLYLALGWGKLSIHTIYIYIYLFPNLRSSHPSPNGSVRTFLWITSVEYSIEWTRRQQTLETCLPSSICHCCCCRWNCSHQLKLLKNTSPTLHLLATIAVGFPKLHLATGKINFKDLQSGYDWLISTPPSGFLHPCESCL